MMIQTFKRTTICVTKAGVVYACGDKFAKNIKLSAKNPLPFGFYALPVDLSGKKPTAVEEVKDKPKQSEESKPKAKSLDSEDDACMGNLFGDDEDGEKP